MVGGGRLAKRWAVTYREMDGIEITGKGW